MILPYNFSLPLLFFFFFGQTSLSLELSVYMCLHIINEINTYLLVMIFYSLWCGFQVQRHLQLRIEAQGKYMQTILEKACQTLAGDQSMATAAGYNNGNKVVGGMGMNMNMSMSMNISASSSSTSHLDQAAAGHRGGVMLLPGDHVPSAIKDFGSLNFPSFQDLNLYGTSQSPSPPAVAAAGGAPSC